MDEQCAAASEVVPSAMVDKVKITVAALLVLAGSSASTTRNNRWWCAWRMVVGGNCWRRRDRPGHRSQGKRSASFAKEAVEETRKVVWPTRKETFQTTAIVFAFVVVMALFSGSSTRCSSGAGVRPDPGVEAMSKRWYVVHAYSGFEKSVARALLDRIRARRHAGQVRPDPGADRGSGRDEERPEEHQRAQVLPGYVLVEMEMTDDTWHLVKNTAQGHRLRRRHGAPSRRRSARRK
jgi:preprotein translocase SecE subunit